MNRLYLMTQGYSSSDSILELLGLIILFIVIIIACYYVTKFVASKQMSKQAISNFKVVDTFRISQNKYLQLMKIGEKYIVIAVSKDTITMLTEVKEEELVYKKDEENLTLNFKEILASTFKKNKELEESYSDLQKKEKKTKNIE